MKIIKYMLEKILEHCQIRGLVTIQEILDELKELKDTDIIEETIVNLEPKEELKEIEELDNRVAFKTTDLESGIEKEYKWDFTDIIQNTKINELIENQNKIIRELKANKEQ